VLKGAGIHGGPNREVIHVDASTVLVGGEPRDPATLPPVQCLICYETEHEYSALGCGHAFCNECYTTFLSHKIADEGYNCIFGTCPDVKVRLSRAILACSVVVMPSSHPPHLPLARFDARFLPRAQCSLVVSERLAHSLPLSREKRVLFDRALRLERSYVDDNPNLKWCTAADCSCAIRARKGQIGVKCSCGNRFCFTCNQEDHRPATCEELQLWQVKCRDKKNSVLPHFCTHGCCSADCLRPLSRPYFFDQGNRRTSSRYSSPTLTFPRFGIQLWQVKCRDDSETYNWLMSNTKACPKCSTSIEKNGGCNHMTCKNTSCKFEFCWVCLGPWKDHSGSYYSCNRYDPDKDKSNPEANKKDSSRAALERYLHYYTRYTNHLNSLKFEMEAKQKMEEKIKQMELQGDKIWMDCNYLNEANEALYECRYALQFTCATRPQPQLGWFARRARTPSSP
jgi:ariadne-1